MTGVVNSPEPDEWEISASGSIDSSHGAPPIDFLADQMHPIDSVLESRSWMRDVDSVSAGGRTEDEVRRDEELLRLSEQRLSQELEEAVLAMDFVVVTKQKPRVPKKQTIRMDAIDIEMIERDARSTPCSSYPSDEARIVEDESSSESVSREQPERSPDLALIQHMSNVSVATEDMLKYECMNNEDSTEEGLQILPHNDHQLESIAGHATLASTTTSDWKEGSFRDASIDLESGQSDIFQREGFWEEGLWLGNTIWVLLLRATFLSATLKKEDQHASHQKV